MGLLMVAYGVFEVSDTYIWFCTDHTFPLKMEHTDSAPQQAVCTVCVIMAVQCVSMPTKIYFGEQKHTEWHTEIKENQNKQRFTELLNVKTRCLQNSTPTANYW